MDLLNCDDVVLELYHAPVDPRTGNKVIYGASWAADRDSMIGKRNEDWVQRELKWFVEGSRNLNDMTPPVPQAFQDCANDVGEVNSAYGHTLFSGDIIPSGDSLFGTAVQAFLDEGLGTRHSVAVITDRDIQAISTENGKKDFICTNALNFMVDADNKLHIFAQMRSMDAVWGFRADYSMWALLMDMMVAELSKEYPEVRHGNVVFQVANLHVYPRHFEMLEKEAESIIEGLERSAWL